ncbi:MAG: hypothetical protein NVSMB38_19260 [Ktedonobacteraceae bacterium]
MQIASNSVRVLRSHLLEILLLALLGCILFFGAFWKYFDVHSNAWYYSDVAKYECYAHGFWQGTSGLTLFPKAQCGFLVPSSSPQPFHTLPREYPLLVLIPFSLALLAPLPFYHVAFACLMALLAGTIYFVLKYVRTQGAAVAFLIYLLLGCWSTAGGRFDLIPSALTLLAVICAEKIRWKWAFALLAVATMFKFYPLILVPPFLIAQQMQYKSTWYAWRRVLALGIFAGICAGITLLSLGLSVDGTLAPLSYFKARPIQIESLSASVLWLAGILGRYQLIYVYSYGSYNVISPLSSLVSQGGTLFLVLGLAYTWWLQWRGNMSLPFSVVITLLVVMVTGKVFSPQYLIWVAPLIAYIGEERWKWLLGWGSVSIVTTLIYPCLYERAYFSFIPFLPPLYATIFVRNMLLLLFIVALLYRVSRRNNTQEGAVSYHPTIHQKKYA